MNKKGQQVMVGMMIGIFLFIAITQLIEPFKDVVTDVRAVDKLDCTNSSITPGQKGTCILVDWGLFYWVGISMGAAIGGLGGLALKKK